jgi:hypothetical protein
MKAMAQTPCVFASHRPAGAACAPNDDEPEASVTQAWALFLTRNVWVVRESVEQIFGRACDAAVGNRKKEPTGVMNERSS